MSLQTIATKKSRFHVIGSGEMLLPVLPEEIVEKILESVPFEDVPSWRRVCQRWNQRISSGQIAPSGGARRSLPLLVQNQQFPSLPEISVFNVPLQVWQKLSMSFLPPPDQGPSIEPPSVSVGTSNSNSSIASRKSPSSSNCHFYKCATAESLGLIFISVSSLNPVQPWTERLPNLKVIVCNPMSKSWKSLEVPKEISDGALGLGIVGVHVYGDCGNSYYKLLLARCDWLQPLRILWGMRNSKSYATFDSQFNFWRMSPDSPDPIKNYMYSKVYADGCVYFLHRSYTTPNNPTIDWRNPQMGKYNFEVDTWEDISPLPKHKGGQLPQLVAQGGKVLYLTIKSFQKNFAIRKTWCFYELNEEPATAAGPRGDTKRWKKVREMPPDLFDSLSLKCQVSQRHQSLCCGSACAADGSLIYFYGVEPLRVDRLEGRGSGHALHSAESGDAKCVLVHDFRLDTWTWLPNHNTRGDDLLFLRPSFHPV